MDGGKMKKMLMIVICLLVINILAAENCKEINTCGYKIILEPPAEYVDYRFPTEENTQFNICYVDSDTLRFDKGIIWINNDMVGLINPEDSLELKKGQIYCNGVLQKPVKNYRYHGFFAAGATENNARLGKHSLTIKPFQDGASHYSAVVNDMDTHYYLLDKYKVEIRNNMLFINFKNYGKLNRISDILIDNDKIYINGEEVTL